LNNPQTEAALSVDDTTIAREAPPITSQRRLAIAGMAANILEWYDFSIYMHRGRTKPQPMHALLGGTAPMVATYLIDKTDNEMVPPMYLIAAAIVSAIFVLTLKETSVRMSGATTE
jgi:hypothetical protein